MGRFYENAIMYGLQGRTLEGVPYDDKPLSKGKKRAALAPEILFLLTIAARQPDPRDRHDGLKTKCWGDPATLCSIMHIGKSAFHTCRDKLVKLGILLYARKEGDHTNVYRINLRYLRNFYPDDAVWRYDILKISEKEVVSENVLTELCATSGSCCQDLTEVRETDKKVRKTDKKVRETDKKVRKTDTNNNTTINNSHTTEVGDDVDAHYLDELVGSIAAKLKVERTKIDREKLAKAVKGKFPDSVYKLIEKPPAWCLAEAKHPAAALICELDKLPLQEDDPNYKRNHPQTVNEFLQCIASIPEHYLMECVVKATQCDDVNNLKYVHQLIHVALAGVNGGAEAEKAMRRRIAEAIDKVGLDVDKTPDAAMKRLKSAITAILPRR